MKTIVGDDENYLEHAVRDSLERTPILITIGGLGPTEDDVTQESCGARSAAPAGSRRRNTGADFNGDSKRAVSRCRLTMRGRRLYLTGSEILENKNGTAPGLWIASERNHVILLPGPPSELKPMFESLCVPRLQKMAGGVALARSVFRTAGLPESDARCANRADLHEVQKPRDDGSRETGPSRSPAYGARQRIRKRRNAC